MTNLTVHDNAQGCSLRGIVLGALCLQLGFYDRIAGARIVLRPGDGDGRPLPGGALPAPGELKAVVRAISQKRFEMYAGADSIVAAVDDNGMFCIPPGEYQGAPVDVYICINGVPYHAAGAGTGPTTAPLPQPAYYSLGRYKPVKVGEFWYLIAVLPQPVWCGLRRRADVWTIAGSVTTCQGGEPLGAVQVEAFDTDIVRDDALGSAETDLSGRFRIDYRGETYRKGTIVDVELFGGPDVYFKVRSPTGAVLLDEPPSQGRTAGRCNSGPCLCVALRSSSDEARPLPRGVNAWLGIGSALSILDALNLNSFDAEGYAGPARCGLTGAIRMVGAVSYLCAGQGAQQGFRTAGGLPLRYRFLVSGSAGSNTIPQAPVPEAAFTRVVGAGPPEDVALFRPVKLGELVRSRPYKKVDVHTSVHDLDADGWYDPNQALLRTFSDPALQNLAAGEPPLTPADMPDFSFSWVRGALMRLDTTGLAGAPTTPTAGLQADQPTPSGDILPVERVAFRFELRAFDDAAATSYPLPADGTQLDAAVIGNNPVVQP